MGTLGLIKIIAAILLGGSMALARPLTERELLARCYSQLTGTRLSHRDPLWSQLNTRKAAAICKGLVADTLLGADGMLSNSQDPLKRKILKQFNDFHRSWFKHKLQGQAQFGEGLYGTIDIHEPTEPALFVTRALFAPGFHYRNVLRGSDRLEALRDSSTASSAGSPSGFKRATRYLFRQYDGVPEFDMNAHSVVVATDTQVTTLAPFQTVTVPLIQVGALIGVRARTESALTPRVLTRHTGSTSTINEPGVVVPAEIRKNFGGGAIGSQPFVLFNFGHGFDFIGDGARKLPRAWAQAAFQTFLCTPEPYLRSSDVTSFVRTGANVPPFRAELSCLQCHGTLDQAAMVARNLVPASTSMTPQPVARGTALVAEFAAVAGPEAGQEFWPAAPTSTFRQQGAAGRLYFRSFTGALVDKTITNGIEGLGQALSETEDYYACAARRYFEFFTGVKMPLADVSGREPGDPIYEKEKKWREFILGLGRELRATGSLKTLIGRILESDDYRSSNFGK